MVNLLSGWICRTSKFQRLRGIQRVSIHKDGNSRIWTKLLNMAQLLSRYRLLAQTIGTKQDSFWNRIYRNWERRTNRRFRWSISQGRNQMKNCHFSKTRTSRQRSNHQWIAHAWVRRKKTCLISKWNCKYSAIRISSLIMTHSTEALWQQQAQPDKRIPQIGRIGNQIRHFQITKTLFPQPIHQVTMSGEACLWSHQTTEHFLAFSENRAAKSWNKGSKRKLKRSFNWKHLRKNLSSMITKNLKTSLINQRKHIEI